MDVMADRIDEYLDDYDRRLAEEFERRCDELHATLKAAGIPDHRRAVIMDVAHGKRKPLYLSERRILQDWRGF